LATPQQEMLNGEC